MQDGRKGESLQASKYNVGFQGQRTDDEIKGDGNSVNYKYRMHDPRIGRFFAIDPLASQYAHNSTYAFSENVVISAVELEGLEKKELSPVADATSDYFKGLLTNIFDVDPFNVALIGMKLGSGDTEGAKETAKESFTTLIGVPGNSAFKSGVCIAKGDSYGAKYYGTTSFLELVTIIATMRCAPEVIIRPKFTMNNIIETSTVRKAKVRAPEHYYDRMGGYNKALDEFYNLDGIKNIKPLEGKHKGFQGELADGTKVSVREGSRGRLSGKSEPTLQFTPVEGASKKIRYTEDGQ